MDDVVLNKVASIERCLQRISDEYHGHESDWRGDYTRQDAIVLNLLRACEATIDAAMHIIRSKRLGVPQSSCPRCVSCQFGSYAPIPGFSPGGKLDP